MTNHATFDVFWSLYPRRVAKRAALKEWEKEVRAGTNPEDIIAGLRRQLPQMARKEPQFIPHARTWLHQGRWEDEPEPTPIAPSGKRTAIDAVRDMLQ
jgi:hypothetical protein